MRTASPSIRCARALVRVLLAAVVVGLSLATLGTNFGERALSRLGDLRAE
jgi:hypothetical protein